MLGLKMIEDSMKQYPSEEWPHHITADMINDMRGSCDVAVSTLNDLLMYEKIEGNLMKLELEEMKIYDSVKTVIKSFNVQVAEYCIHLQY
jgi:signal transduction histidine kinase